MDVVGFIYFLAKSASLRYPIHNTVFLFILGFSVIAWELFALFPIAVFLFFIRVYSEVLFFVASVWRTSSKPPQYMGHINLSAFVPLHAVAGKYLSC